MNTWSILGRILLGLAIARVLSLAMAEETAMEETESTDTGSTEMLSDTEPSSSLSDGETAGPSMRTRKRKRSIASWQKSKRKRGRNSGKLYNSATKQVVGDACANFFVHT